MRAVGDPDLRIARVPLGERLGLKGYVGAALMLVSLVVMEVEIPFFDKTAEKAD